MYLAIVPSVQAQERAENYVQDIQGTDQRIPMVWVDGGAVTVSSYVPRERNARSEKRQRVTVDGFWIGKYELRYLEFQVWSRDMASREDQLAQRLSKLNGTHGLGHFMLDTRPDAPHRPATGMNQWSAKRYCHWLSIRTGRFYRLPTEAEWELACRGGGPSLANFPWGDDAQRLAEFAVIGSGTENERCNLVGQKKPNGLGLFDMLGNVEEWTADGFHENCISGTVLHNPIVWPASSRGLAKPPEVWDAMREVGHVFVDGYGAAKGGSGLTSRPTHGRAFTVSARTDPTSYDDGDAGFAPQDVPREMSYTVEAAIGFRIARPAEIPQRHIQLWHWGIYSDGDQWLDTTLDPGSTQHEESKR